jgi:CRP/FNR family cyclic AMP-dependent transcriptional regulator
MPPTEILSGRAPGSVLTLNQAIFTRGISNMAGLGKIYQDGEVIVRQGETGNCMYVVQEGRVEAVDESEGKAVVLRTLSRNDFFGEMALFEKDLRTVTIRAVGTARVLTIDRRQFLRGIHEDPSLAMRVIKTMSHRIRDLTGRLGKYEQTESADVI